MDMATNRINNQPDNPEEPGQKIVVVQTPAGVIKLALPAGGTTDGRDPVAVAMDTFQSAVDRGAEDPLAETLHELRQLAEQGTTQPLQVGLAILKEMSESGMLPPMPLILQGTGLSVGDVAKALGGELPARRRGLFEKLDQTNFSTELLN